MKKSILISIMVLCAVFAHAADWGVYTLTGTGAGAAGSKVLGPVAGKSIVCESFSSSVTTSGVATVYSGNAIETLQAAASSATTVTVTSASSGTMGGILPTTSDKLIVNGTYTAISGVTTNGCETNGYITLVVGTAVTGSAGDKVYLCDADAAVVIPLSSSADTIGRPNMFAGEAGMPVAVTVPAGLGTYTVSGLVSYRK